jgi:hypothetical protein
MKFAIRTLAALLALSSTAVAEDWTGVGTLQRYGGTPSFEEVLPPGSENSNYINRDEYEFYTSIGVSVPAQIVQSQRQEATVSSGISVRNGAGIIAACLGDVQPGILFPFEPTVAGYSSGMAGSRRLQDSSCSGVVNGAYYVPITEFARSDTVSAMAANVVALEQRILALEATPVLFEELDTKLQYARREADEGSAMAAAMTTVAPADGKANRIGFNTATYNGSTAVAVSYSRAAGDVDFNVGVAMAGDNAMVKAGAGFSW